MVCKEQGEVVVCCVSPRLAVNSPHVSLTLRDACRLATPFVGCPCARCCWPRHLVPPCNSHC
jgi:hypothetical protein